MSFPSCIKMPVSRSDSVSDNDSNGTNDPENHSTTYNDLILIANEVFGHGKWSHAVTSQTVDFVEYVMGKYHIGCAAFVKVQLPDGTYHEEMGYSNAESSIKGSAVYSARRSSITNAFRKALLCFGGIIEEKIEGIQPSSHKRKIIKLYNTDNQSDKLKSDLVKASKPTVLSSTNVNNPIVVKKETSPVIDDKNQAKVVETVLPESTIKREVETKPVINSKSTSSVASLQYTRSSTKPNNVDNGSTRQMTEEELRLERKRKQREKQEEYRRLMKEKEAKSEDKSQVVSEIFFQSEPWKM
ncbi:DNA repair protein RAD52 homolog [Chelonus insularis]|uniref:DNA repair protein RAD52 homolog n=1 Tax=Chelonus insularis TaxID=460826 RepID=UPI00158A5C25|nr:DNA repair protein RAD52 homolog [Chelonus insularis]